MREVKMSECGLIVLLNEGLKARGDKEEVLWVSRNKKGIYELTMVDVEPDGNAEVEEEIDEVMEGHRDED